VYMLSRPLYANMYVVIFKINTLNEVASNGEGPNHDKYPSHGKGVHGRRVVLAALGRGRDGDGVLRGTDRLRGQHARRAAKVEQWAVCHGVDGRVGGGGEVVCCGALGALERYVSNGFRGVQLRG
jgi:hypothetical protein